MDYGILVWSDAFSAAVRLSPHPYLVFVPTSGTLLIADDFEPSNDPAAREFHISRRDAVSLATTLLNFARRGYE